MSKLDRRRAPGLQCPRCGGVTLLVPMRWHDGMGVDNKPGFYCPTCRVSSPPWASLVGQRTAWESGEFFGLEDRWIPEP